VPERWIEPPDQRAVADEGIEAICLIRPPFLVAEEEKHDHHRCTDDVIVEVSRKHAGPAQDDDDRIERSADERIHDRDLSIRERPFWTHSPRAAFSGLLRLR
jgi:hypothetical protein